MEECIQRILSDVDGAIDWVIQGKDEHPNRLDIIRESSNRGRSSRGGRGGRGDFASRVEQPSPNQSSSAGNSTFGHQANQSPFGQPARQGSPFGQPAFGQAPFSQTSTLVQNSPFGSPAQPAFGQSPFGQHQQQTQPASFGQLNENEFAQHQNANQFDQSMQQDQPMVTSPFGQPQQPHNAFGHPDQSEANPFAQAQASANGGFNMSAQQQAAMNGGQMIVEDPPAAMFGLNEQQFKEAYEQAKQAGGFQDGAVPMFAPKSEWRS
jgi:nucleoporin NUP42